MTRAHQSANLVLMLFAAQAVLWQQPSMMVQLKIGSGNTGDEGRMWLVGSTHLLVSLVGLAGGDIDFKGFARMLSFSASQGAACRRSSSERLGRPGSLTLRMWWAWLALKRCKWFRKLCLHHSKGGLSAAS